METLDEMEKTPTNPLNDTPLIDIVITDAMVVFDPFLHLEEEKLEEIKKDEEAQNAVEKGEWFSNPSAAFTKPAVVKEGVGRYIAPTAGDQQTLSTQIDFGGAVVASGKKKHKTSGFGNVF